jgi:hypothetical protein
MLGRRRINSSAPLRSSLSNAAFAVEERVVWGGLDVFRRIVEVVKWPFERAVWAIERGLVWPLEERTGDWSGPLRGAGVAVLALLAVGAGVTGLLWASGSGSSAAPQGRQASNPVVAPIVKQAPPEAPAQVEPALQGAVPNFKADVGNPTAKDGATATKATEATDASAIATADSPATTSPSGSSAAPAVEPAGPPATKVARQFAGAFVLYEIGRNEAKVRETFTATATPQLARSLLERPPRLPADVQVPQAKVLNVVPGPKVGDTYTLSVSLLRVGVASELRIDMQRNDKSGEWQVARVLV